ncbi:MAG TPA: hypothetical protein VGG41_20730 [Solirubrobacteraceae bacterium]
MQHTQPLEHAVGHKTTNAPVALTTTKTETQCQMLKTDDAITADPLDELAVAHRQHRPTHA